MAGLYRKEKLGKGSKVYGLKRFRAGEEEQREAIVTEPGASICFGMLIDSTVGLSS